MGKLNPWVTSAALTITLVVVYALCAAVPATTIDFLNAWFHGLNLAGLRGGAKPSTPGIFLYGLVGVAVFAFVCGAQFAVSHNWLRRRATG